MDTPGSVCNYHLSVSFRVLYSTKEVTMLNETLYSETAITKEQYYQRMAEREQAVAEMRASHMEMERIKANRRRRIKEAHEEEERKRKHDKLLYDILSYAVAHGWRRDRLFLLLEEGEELPWMFREEQIIPLVAVNEVKS